jgi:hypothetical protein
MAGTDSDTPFQRIQELEEENQVLRERLEQADEDNDCLRREIERLRRELKAAGRGQGCRKRKLKADPQRPGRKAGQGRLGIGVPNPAKPEPNRTWKSEVFQKCFEPAWIQGAEAPEKNFLPAKSRISP